VRTQADVLMVDATPVRIRVDASDAPPSMTGLSIRVADLAATERVLRDAQVRMRRDAQGIEVDAAEAFNVTLRFHA
jgi:hypothetical protein